jgi:hypothetical protein
MANNPGSEVQQSDANGGLNLKRLIIVGVAVGVAAFALKQLPDLRRYLKLRSM